MKIENNSLPGVVSGENPAAKPLKAVLEKTGADSAEFGNLDELEISIKSQQDVRTGVVEKAAALVNQSQWPLKEMLRKVASLLSMAMEKSS
jgi:hypothetical protein